LGLDLSVAVFGEDVIRRRFNRFAARAQDMSPAFHQVAGILRDATAENFATRGVSGGSRWRDLAPSTRARKARLGLDPRILRETGRLYHSLVGRKGTVGRSDLTGRFQPGSNDHVEEVGPDRLVWGSRVPYGRFHQSSAPRTKIPYRPPVKLNERRKREIAKAMQRALVEGTR
jgi:phage gpG-like protein